MQNKIAILIPYFGTMPHWFDYFLLSCSKNPEIDWFFFTDCLKSEFLYPNTRFIPMSLKEFNLLATNKLGFPIQIRHAYKLCELKPAYGLLFEEYLEGYIFWGYGDIDLVYGNIIRFFPENWETTYDAIASDSEFIPGHLCVLKNSPEIKRLFEHIQSYRKVFQSQLYHGLDEIFHPVKVIPAPKFLSVSKEIKIGYHLMLSHFIRLIKKTILYKFLKNRAKEVQNSPNLPRDFTSMVKMLSSKGKIHVLFKTFYQCDLMLHEQNMKNWKIDWTEGVLINSDTRKELMYFHFSRSKNSRKFRVNKFNPSLQSFSITKHGIQ